MEKLIRFLKKILFLPPLLVVLIALPSFVLVAYVLISGLEDTPLTYVSYLLSAYGCIISVVGIVNLVQSIRSGFQSSPLVRRIVNSSAGSRYLKDVAFRTKVSLYQGSLVNLAYVAVKLASGLLYHSSWFLSLAGYYLLLLIMRLFLLRYMGKDASGPSPVRELRRYRGCGIILLLMNQVLAVIVIFMVHRNHSYEYPGTLIYAMAAYSFYAIIFAVVSLVKYRKFQSPVLSAAKVLNLTAAMVSILSLETAMLSQFGAGDDPMFRRMMTSITGAAVCTIVFAMAIFMIFRSSKQLKALKQEPPGHQEPSVP